MLSFENKILPADTPISNNPIATNPPLSFESKIIPVQQTQSQTDINTSSTETTTPDRNIVQKALGLFLDPIIQTGVRTGQTIGDLALTGINKLTGGALNKYTPEGNLSEALSRVENTPASVPIVGTPVQQANSITPENTIGGAVSTVALGLGSPALAGAALGLGGAMQQDKGVVETAVDTVVSAIGGKILEYGFNAVSPYLEKAALKYGQPFLDKVSQYVPDSAKTFMSNLSDKIGNALPDLSKREPSFIQKVVDTANKAETNATNSFNNYLKNKISGRTAEQVLATPESDVAKLKPDEQKLWYKNQAQIATQKANDALASAENASNESISQAKASINDFNQQLGQTNRDTAISLKEPAQQLMKDSSAKYVELTGEAADGSKSLSKTVAVEDLSSAIDSKFEFNPEVGASLKSDLGITQKPTVVIDPKTKLPVIETAPAQKTLTNQEILDKAREIISTVSKSSKSGGKVYSYSEFQAMQKYSFLMEQLNKNGVDMSKANQFWKEWAPVRDRILREVKPFDENNIGKMPITSTINKAEAPATTATQVASKLDAQNFISELETRMNIPKGSIGAATRSAIENVEKAKLAKINVENLASEIQKQIKLDKANALKEMTLRQYNTLKQQRVSSIVKKILIGIGIYATARATGIDKAVLGIVKAVI